MLWAVNVLMTFAHSGHRNIKISGRWTCSLEIVHAFPPFWFSNPQTIICSMLSMVHTDTQHIG